MDIHFPESTKEYTQLQCNNKLSKYTTCPEVKPVEDLFKNLCPKNVLELGAGLGRVSVYLLKQFGWTDTHFYLLDGDSGHKQIANLHNRIGKDFYNSLSATRDFCLGNGMKENQLTLWNIEKEDWKITPVQFDLCYSFKAMGFHWPIGEYLQRFASWMVKGAYLVFEIRDNSQQAFIDFNKKQMKGVPTQWYEVVELSMQPKQAILILRRV